MWNNTHKEKVNSCYSILILFLKLTFFYTSPFLWEQPQDENPFTHLLQTEEVGMLSKGHNAIHIVIDLIFYKTSQNKWFINKSIEIMSLRDPYKTSVREAAEMKGDCGWYVK